MELGNLYVKSTISRFGHVYHGIQATCNTKYENSQCWARKRIDASFMMIRPGFARRNSRVRFLLFLAVDAVCDGSRELSMTFFSY